MLRQCAVICWRFSLNLTVAGLPWLGGKILYMATTNLMVANACQVIAPMLVSAPILHPVIDSAAFICPPYQRQWFQNDGAVPHLIKALAPALFQTADLP
jgi:hypothetical protein